ncbi:MAG: hypothetical protein ACETWB_09795 [Anaerolineae bacterium]
MKIFVAVLVVVVLGAGVVGAVVLAQEPTPTPTKPRQGLRQTYWQTLADKLGVKVEVLQQDARDAARETIQQAVNDGVLTQKQADALLRRLDQQAPGALPFGGPFRGRGWRPGWMTPTTAACLLFPPIARDISPVWSPNGTKIAFGSASTTTGKSMSWTPMGRTGCG